MSPIIDVGDEGGQPRRRHKTVTEKQVAANRENARKGGPNTPEGRQRSSRNATTSGVWAESLYPIPGGEFREDPEAFEAYVTAIIDGLGPRDLLESEGAKRVALEFVRLGRLDRLEAEATAGAGRLTALDYQLLSDPRSARASMSARTSTTSKPSDGAVPEPPADLAEIIASATGGEKPDNEASYWAGTDEDVSRLFRAAREILDLIREPELVDDPAWEEMARLIRRHHEKGRRAVLPGLWDDETEPLESDQWQQCFESLRAAVWESDDDAVRWAMKFTRDEIPRLGMVAGKALALAANRLLGGPAPMLARLRGQATRDLVTHLAVYARLQQRTLE